MLREQSSRDRMRESDECGLVWLVLVRCQHVSAIILFQHRRSPLVRLNILSWPSVPAALDLESLYAFFNLFEFCGLLLAERFFPPTVVFEPLEPQSPVMSGRNRDAISVELPSVNPFAESEPRGGRGGQSGGRASRQPTGNRRVPRAQPDYDDEPMDEDYNPRQANVTVLSTANPFGSSDPPRGARLGGHPNARPSIRGAGRAQYRDDLDQRDEAPRGITMLPTRNPFAGEGRGVPRVVEPDDPVTNSEDEEYGEEEPEYAPPPPPRRANPLGNERAGRPANRTRPSEERQRMGNPRNQLRPTGPPEDDRLVISWVDEGMVSPPRSPADRHGHDHSSVTSESESYFALRPDGRNGRPASPGHGHGHRSHSRHRDHHTHHDHGHHSHHDHGHHSHHDRHCRQCHRLAIPPWQPPFPMPPPDWSGYGAPRSPYSPAPPYALGRPLYANIPDLPSLLDQCRVPYPPVPVAPVAFLRDLRTQGSPGSESPLTGLPVSLPVEVPVNPEEWKKMLECLTTKNTLGVVALLKGQEFSTSHVDRVFRRLTNVVQVRFGERQGNEIVNRVHLVPRGRLAAGTIMSQRPKIDVDLVIPSDFILRRWNVTAAETDENRPKTIADALELHPASINRGEIEASKLRSVFRAVWEQLNGSADGFIFPGGRDEAERYLPKDWCAPYKDDIQDANRLRLATWGPVKVVINIFVKVSMSMYGQDMIVGVDQSSAKLDGKYQLVKTLRTPGVPLSDPALSPNLRTSIRLLCWSQYFLGVVAPGSTPVRASHFHIALTALQQLDPSDDLYIAPTSRAEAFSMGEVLKAAVKILRFLSSAYVPPVVDPLGGYPFPLSSCTLSDALYTQVSAKLLRAPTTLACVVAVLAQLAPFALAASALSGATSGGLGSIADKMASKVADVVTDKVAPAAGDAAAGLVTDAAKALSAKINEGDAKAPGSVSGADTAPPPPETPVVETPPPGGSTRDKPTGGPSKPQSPDPRSDAKKAPSNGGGSQQTDKPKPRR